MKIKLLPIALFIVCFSNFSFGQLTNANNISPNGIFDKVFNRFGDKLNLEDLLIDKNGDGTTKALGPLCSSGYFDLYFEVGSGMEGNSTIEQERRAVICQVFSDISQFIETPNPNIHVNILVKNINPVLNGYDPITNPNPSVSSGVLGLATSYYVLPSLGPNIIGGIADNEIWKTINSGIDSYTNVASPLSSTSISNNGSGYYHGMVALNFNNPSINWHLDLSQNTSNGLYDLYSVILHEVTHALGFASLIDVNGDSKFGTNFPYYSRYDLFLNSPSNQPLITNTGTCSMYNYGFNPSLSTSILTPSAFSCTSHVKFAGSVNQATYTPTVFTNESSLSHLEDLCHDPNNYANDEYYVMSNANGSGPFYMKRYLKPEERDVLCDIGYKVNSNFGNSSNLNFYDYGAPACPGAEVIGINDGIDPYGNVQFYTVVNNSSNPLPITNICNNDFNGFTFECLEDLYGNGYPMNITSNGFSYVATSPGIAVLRYVPISATGVRGNITYIYIYISANNCNPTNCNFINNGDFELSTNCGQMDYQSPINSACWSPLSNTPDIFLRNCTNNVNNTNGVLSIPAYYGSNPPSESWNGPPNNSFIGIMSTSAHFNESIQTALNSPFVHGHHYTISFYARCANNFIPLGASGQIIIGGTTNFIAPYGGASTVLPSNIFQLGNAVSVVNDLNWHLITETFQYTGQPNLNHLVIYNSSNLNSITGQSTVYLFIDQVELTEIQTTINLTLPQVICINQTINDLSLYAPITGGTFNGPGVSLTGNTFSFNPQSAGVGTHSISYTYINNLNCPVTITQQIEVVSSTFTASISASSTQICSGQSVNLTAISSSPASYSWNPGNLTGVSINPNINTSTLFSLTATNSIGCIASASVNIIALPSSLNVTPSNSTICSGQSVDLTASGANSYVWTPNTELSSANSSVVSATPASSIVYTVTGTNTSGCTETATATINVNPLPIIQISPNNPTICSGQSISITASGADTYVWSPAQGLSATTESNVIANPSNTTTYNVQGQNSLGCTASELVTITVNPNPSVLISSSNNSICIGQQVTLAATGALNYTWSPSSALSSITGSVVITSPNMNTSYNVTGIDANGCTSMSSINLIVNLCKDCNDGVLITGNIVNSPTSSATLRIQNDISITGNVIFNANIVKIMPGVTITVKPNATLTLNGSHLYGCQTMWKGIIVEPGGKVILQPYYFPNGNFKTTLIEDAITGIEFLPILTQQNSNVLFCDNVTFNKNKTAIKINGYLFNNPSTVFDIKNTLITSRNICDPNSVVWPNTSTVKAFNPIVNTLLSPYISPIFGLSNLKTPNQNISAQIGLDLINIGSTSVTYPTNYYSLIMGSLIPNEYNVFDNLNIGINSLNSNLKIQNSIFQFSNQIINNTSNNAYLNIISPTQGSGIACRSISPNKNLVDVAGTSNIPNQFYGLSIAFFSDNLKEVLFNNNIVRSNMIDYQGNTNNIVGFRGVYIRENDKFQNIEVNNNIFYSIKRGISLISNVAGFSPNVSISNNQFKFKPGINYGNVGLDHAILLENSNSTNQMAGGVLYINNNTIYNVNTGIKASSWRNINLQINSNNISFKECGINVENCIKGTTANQINFNNVSGFTNFGNNENYRAIVIKSSIGNIISCNSVSNSYSGIYFHSNCNPSKTSRNSMTNHKYGFVLDNNGIIGVQGSLTNPADNLWLGITWDPTGTTNGEFKTACLNGSNSINSKMYIRNLSGIYSPNGSTISTNGIFQYNYGAPQSILLAQNAQAPTTCSTISNPPVSALTTADIIDALETIASQINDTSFSYDQEKILIDEIFRALESDTTLLQNSFNLNSFYDIVKVSNTGILYDVERSLANDSIQNAQILNNSVIPENLVEESYKKYYEVYLNFMNDNLTQQDSITLTNLAQGCPTIQGSAVYLSEALFNFIFIQDTIFIQSCPEYLEKSSFDDLTNDPFEQFQIYPVPNNGHFIVRGPLKKGQKLEVISLDNKILHSYELMENTDAFQIKVELCSGVYYIILKDDSNTHIFRRKFIIVK